MIRAAMLSALALLGACAGLQSAPLPEVGPPEYARVAAQRPLNIRAGETRAERAAWAVLSRDPVILSGAVLGLEDGFGRTQLSEYDLALTSGGTATIQSRYVARPGQRVMVRRPVGEGYPIVVGVADSRCAAAPSP